ncbi:hypothetical protein DIPPA_05790 [Diplonema papillatum]|nr:hypothetical protein DIPPA_05790 [Diplonema papillatum]
MMQSYGRDDPDRPDDEDEGVREDGLDSPRAVIARELAAGRPRQQGTSVTADMLMNTGSEMAAAFRATHRAPPPDSAVPTLMSSSIKIQRLWRGYTVRKDLGTILKRGGTYKAYLAHKVLKDVESLEHHQADDIKTAVLQSRDVLPIGPYAAWASTATPWERLGTTSGSVSSFMTPGKKKKNLVRIWQCVRHWSPHWLLVVCICILVPATATCLYFAPGWAALLLGLVFEERQTGSSVKKLMSWIFAFMLVCALGLILLRVCLVTAAEQFTAAVDFVLSMIGCKFSNLINRDRLQKLRCRDLGIVKTAVFADFPWFVIHTLHVLLSLGTVFVLHPVLGAVNLGVVVLAAVLLTLSDRLILSQLHMLSVVRKYQDSLNRNCPQPIAANVTSDHSRWSFYLGISKMTLRLSRTYGRIHAYVSFTVIMMMLAIPIFFLYLACLQVKKTRITLEDMAFAFLYFLFTQGSFYFAVLRANQCLFARREMLRVFTAAWHFRDFSERRVFHEKECSIVAAVDNIKINRRQPRSLDLAIIVGFCYAIIVVWFIFFVSATSFECESASLECYSDSPAEGRVRETSVPLAFGFNFFAGCTPLRPVSGTLHLCAYNSLKRFRRSHGERWGVSVWYRTWRDRRRGYRKQFEGTVSGSGLYACPAAEDGKFTNQPFMNTFELRDTENTPLTDGLIGPYDFRDRKASSVFFADNSFRACGNDVVPPKNACKYPRSGLWQCWCDAGMPQSYPVCVLPP